MAIRLRNSVALCAAETDPQHGDLYLDDAQHYALAAKFARDWQGQTVDWQYQEMWREMDRHKIRDAEETLNIWLASQLAEA